MGLDSISRDVNTFFTRLINSSVARVAIVQHGNASKEAAKEIIDGFARVGFEGFESKSLQHDYLKSIDK